MAWISWRSTIFFDMQNTFFFKTVSLDKVYTMAPVDLQVPGVVLYPSVTDVKLHQKGWWNLRLTCRKCQHLPCSGVFVVSVEADLYLNCYYMYTLINKRHKQFNTQQTRLTLEKYLLLVQASWFQGPRSPLFLFCQRACIGTSAKHLQNSVCQHQGVIMEQ